MSRLTAPDGVDHREDEDEEEESQNGPQPHQPRLPLDHCRREQSGVSSLATRLRIPPLPASLTPPLGLTGVGLNWPQDQSCQKGESARGHPESVHPSPSVLAPAQWILGCSQAGGGSGLHPSAGCGRCHHRKWGVGWGSLPWVPGSLGRGPGFQASQHPVSLKLTLTSSLLTARALKGGGSGKVGNSCPEYLQCARSCNRS